MILKISIIRGLNLLVNFPGGSDSKESACDAGNLGSIAESGKSPGEGPSNPFPYSCLENSMNGLAGYSLWCRRVEHN